MYCYSCGKEIREDAKFCSHCGAMQDKKKSVETPSAVKEARAHSHTEELYFEGRQEDIFITVMGLIALSLTVFAFVTLK